MLLNDLTELLLDVPPATAIAWSVWLGVGLLLNIWHRRARAALVVEPPQPRSSSRSKSTDWPASDVRAAAAAPAAPAAESSGDPFGDLEKIFESQAGTHRTPGESPILSSAGTPVLREPDLESTR